MSSIRGQDAHDVLLRLVARGSAIIAELLRLSEMIPAVFRLESKTDSSRYGGIIFDFSFFRITDFEAEFMRKLEQSQSLQERDQEFKENFLDILTRFYGAFDSVHKYSLDLRHFIDDVQEGNFINVTLEGLLLDTDSKQLACEALYLLGVMLLVLEERIEGSTRERMLVSYYRYSAERSSPESNVDDVCNLLRATGYNPSRRPTNYPEDFFKRTKIDRHFSSLVVGRLRSDDVYNQLSAHPLPEHRSVALGTQASMLYVCLFFLPDILNNQSSIMREIVDRFFPDNWIISIFMGITVNLVDSWEPHRAAKAALANTIEPANIKTFLRTHEDHVIKFVPELKRSLKEGVLTEQIVLDKMSTGILNNLRKANVSLRWMMLHCPPPTVNESMSKKNKAIRDIISKETRVDHLDIFRLLLYVSQLEYKSKVIYQKLLDEKETKWKDYKKEVYEGIIELSEVFSGTKPLTRVVKNEGLMNKFKTLADDLDNMTFETATSKKLIKIIQVLDEIQDLHQLESNVQVGQFVSEIRKLLHSMIKTLNLSEDVLITMTIVGDLTYAWKIIDQYTSFMQKGIQSDPTLVIQLRSTFLKLASALDLPLLRINQCSSPDLISVSQFYSTELVAYVRQVLQIIPETMFTLMARIVDLQTNQIQELPTRLMKDQLKTYAQLDARHEVAKLTHDISLFAEGVLMMQTTLVGIIELDPKRLLEDGIRKELVRRVASALHHGLVFNQVTSKTTNKTSDILIKLDQLSSTMDGFKRSFEYIQDYVCIYGLKIWQEEVTRIVQFNVEQECNSFIRRKVHDFDSLYQSKTIPIPQFPPTDNISVNFIGRLTREVLRITDPKTTTFVQEMSSWYDARTRMDIVTPKLFSRMMKGIGTSGLNGVDRLLSFMVSSEVTNTRRLIETILTETTVSSNLSIIDSRTQLDSTKTFSSLVDRASKSWTAINEAISRMGQMQLLKLAISHELSTTGKFESRYLISCLETMNSAVINELSRSDSSRTLPEDSPLLFELSNYLEWTGLSDPLSKIFVADKVVPLLDIILSVLVVSQVSRFAYNPSSHSLMSKRPVDACDGTPFIVGLLTFTRQFRKVDVLQGMIDNLIWFGQQKSEINQDQVNLSLFLRELQRWSRSPTEISPLSVCDL